MNLVVSNNAIKKSTLAKVKQYPQCVSCGSHTTFKAKTCGDTVNYCLHCFMQKKLVLCK
jgi:hypothetical protein